MDELAYIIDKYSLDTSTSPVEIPDTGRVTLASLFAELGYTKGAEIGVAEGRYSEVIAKANPGVDLYCVDSWKAYQGYRDYTDQEKLEMLQRKAQARLINLGCKLIWMESMEAVKHFEDGELDFVYIDANHEWPYVAHDIYYWSAKVRPGGIVSGHDYYRSNRRDSKCHVKGVVNGYTFAFRIHPWFILGLDAKIPGMIRDSSRSWFWVKDERLH